MGVTRTFPGYLYFVPRTLTYFQLVFKRQTSESNLVRGTRKRERARPGVLWQRPVGRLFTDPERRFGYARIPAFGTLQSFFMRGETTAPSYGAESNLPLANTYLAYSAWLRHLASNLCTPPPTFVTQHELLPVVHDFFIMNIPLTRKTPVERDKK